MSETVTERVAPAPYDGFQTMPLAGEWRPDRGGDVRADTHPWSCDSRATP